MTSKEILLLGNLVFSIGGIVGNSIWAASDNIYTLTSAYEFYWFVTVSSLLIGITGGVYHLGILKCSDNDRKMLFYVFAVISVLYPIFWLAAAASVASHLRDCLYVKQRFGLGFRLNLTCDGAIVSTSFGFANFIVWGFVLALVFPYIKQKVKFEQSNENLELNEVQNNTVVVEEVQVPVEVQNTVVEEVPVQEVPVEEVQSNSIEG
jgi:hypothetical protein